MHVSYNTDEQIPGDNHWSLHYTNYTMSWSLVTGAPTHNKNTANLHRSQCPTRLAPYYGNGNLQFLVLVACDHLLYIFTLSSQIDHMEWLMPSLKASFRQMEATSTKWQWRPECSTPAVQSAHPIEDGNELLWFEGWRWDDQQWRIMMIQHRWPASSSPLPPP
jgi:hypothetical protein